MSADARLALLADAEARARVALAHDLARLRAGVAADGAVGELVRARPLRALAAAAAAGAAAGWLVSGGRVVAAGRMLGGSVGLGLGAARLARRWRALRALL
jgi:hypothetical protein